MDAESDRAGLKAVYENYIDAFNARDVAAVNDSYVFPWQLVVRNEVSGVADRVAGRALFEAMFARIEALGWARSVIDEVESWPAGDDGALLIAAIRRVRDDGSLIEGARACYTMVRSNGRWRFSGIIVSFDGERYPDGSNRLEI